MKRKFLAALLTCVLVGSTSVGATTITKDNLTADGLGNYSGSQNVPITATIDSTFTVKLPASIDGNSAIDSSSGKLVITDAKYYVWGDIAPDKELVLGITDAVSGDDTANFLLKEQTTSSIKKSDIKCNAALGTTTFRNEAGDSAVALPSTESDSYNLSVTSATRIPAGTWSGNITVTIGLSDIQ